MAAQQTSGIGKQLPKGWAGTSDWISATYECETFTAAGKFAAQVAALADTQNHHPDLAITYPGHVAITLTSHDSGGVTERDFAQAARIADLATEAGASPLGAGGN